MMNRAPTAVMPDRLAHVHGDEDHHELTRSEERMIDAAADLLIAQKLSDAPWWDEKLSGIDETTTAVPEALARCMANLDSACNGDEIARNAVMTALSNLQKQARLDLQYECEEAAETMLNEGGD